MVMIILSAKLSWASYEDDLKRSKQLKKTLAGYRSPELEKLISKQNRQVILLNNLIKDIQKFKSVDGEFDSESDDFRSNLIKDIKRIQEDDYQNEEFVDRLLSSLDEDFTKKYLSFLSLEVKISKLKEYLDLLLNTQKNPLNLDQESYLDKEVRDYLDKNRNQLSFLLNDLSSSSYFEESKQRILKNNQRLQDANKKFQDQTAKYGELLASTNIPEIRRLEEKIKKIWNDVIIKVHTSDDPDDILRFVSFLMNNEPPNDTLIALLTAFTDYLREDLALMSLEQKEEILWNTLKQKIVKNIIKLPLLGEHSYAALMEKYKNTNLKGFILDAALDANKDWDNLAIIEFIIRNYYADKGESLAVRYDDLLARSLKAKVKILKKQMLYNGASAR